MDTAILYKWSTIAYILIAIAGIYWSYRVIRNKLDDMRHQEELAELEFENSLYGASHMETPSALADTQSSAHPLSTPFPTNTIMASNADPIIQSEAQQEPDIMNHPLIQKLQAARLISNVEFFRKHHGKDKGLVAVKLRNGQIALIVPNWESDAFIQSYEKQVDMIIMPGADGRACVITPFTAFIADTVTF